MSFPDLTTVCASCYKRGFHTVPCEHWKAIPDWLRKHGGHQRPCDCADLCSCGWSEVKKALKETP